MHPILTFNCPPGVAAKNHQFCIAFFLAFTAICNILSTNGVEGEIIPLLCTTSIMQLFFKRRRHGEAGYTASSWMYIRSRQNAELAFRALGLQLHIAITELLKGHSYVR